MAAPNNVVSSQHKDSALNLTSNPLSWLRWWFAPRSVHPAESFRERSIRLILAIYVPSVIIRIFTGERPNEIPIIYAVDLISAAVFTGISTFFVLRHQIDKASGFTFLLLVRTAFFMALNGNFDVVTTTSSLVFFLIFYSLIFKAKYIIPAGIGTVIANSVGALLSIQLSKTNTIELDVTARITSVFFMLLGAGVPLTYIRAQLDLHISELLELVGQLEQRVEERTSELQAANKELTILSGLKDEFVSNVSHELLTPITIMTLQTMLLEKKIPVVKGNKHLAALKREIKRLEHTVDDLLSLSRMDQGRADLKIAPIDLNELIKLFVGDRVPLAQERRITLTHGRTDPEEIINGDETLIGQALSILMTNALTYTPEGGEVKVYTTHRDHEEAPWIGICVSDNGPGVAPEEQSHIFERFYRGTIGQQISHGTGLGLAIASEIVNRHGGKITIESEGVPGQGSVFSLWFPKPLA